MIGWSLISWRGRKRVCRWFESSDWRHPALPFNYISGPSFSMLMWFFPGSNAWCLLICWLILLYICSRQCSDVNYVPGFVLAWSRLSILTPARRLKTIFRPFQPFWLPSLIYLSAPMSLLLEVLCLLLSLPKSISFNPHFLKKEIRVTLLWFFIKPVDQFSISIIFALIKTLFYPLWNIFEILQEYLG